MAPITFSSEIARSPEDVFRYMSDLSRHGEWQESLLSVEVEPAGELRVGTRITEVRQIGRRKITAHSEVSTFEPPRSFSFRGVDGPIRAIGTATVEPAGEGRTRISLTLDFEGHGFGKLFLGTVRKQAARQVPLDHQRLKELLESGGG